MTRRATAASAAVALGLLLLASCQASGGGPKVGDLLPEAELSYPGAEELTRSFRDEERARSVDGPDLSQTARLTRRLRLADGVARSTLLDWYQERLLAAGWVSRARSDNSVDFSKRVGDREHVYLVEGAGAGPDGRLERYAVYYSIGFAGG